MTMRGAITTDIQTVAQLHLKRTISQIELRLMAYIVYVMMNEQRIDIRKVNQDERRVLRKWKNEQHIEGGASGLAITREFWDAMCAILWFGYVIGGATNLPPLTMRRAQEAG